MTPNADVDPAPRRHSAAKRHYAVSLVRVDGMSVNAAAREAGVSPSTLHRWLKTDVAAPSAPSAHEEATPPQQPREWSDKRNAIVGVIAAVVAGLVVAVGASRLDEDTTIEAEGRQEANRVSINSGVGYLRFEVPGGSPPDVVRNRTGEDLHDVWVEARGLDGQAIDFDLASVLSCRWEQVGSSDPDGLRQYEADVVHFTLRGQRWSKTVDGTLTVDESTPPPLKNPKDHTQGELDDCS